MPDSSPIEVPNDSSVPRYVPAFDGFRGLMTLQVVVGHILVGALPMERIWPLAYAVSWYFVLSGFLITRILLHDREGRDLWAVLKTFYMRRALRLLPAYYFTVLVAGLLGAPYLGWLICHGLNLKLYFLSVDPNRAPLYTYLKYRDLNMSHLWSLSAEEQFYLAYPLSLLLCPRASRGWLLFFGIGLSWASRWWLEDHYGYAYYGVLLPVVLEYLCWGALFALFEDHPRIQFFARRSVFYMALVVWAGLMLGPFDPHMKMGLLTPPVNLTPYAFTMGVIVFAMSRNPDAWVCRFLGWAPLRAMGKVSYSAYLLHPLLNPVVDGVLGVLPFLAVPVAPRLLLGPVVYFGAAFVVWHSFEGRLNALKHRWSPIVQAH